VIEKGKMDLLARIKRLVIEDRLFFTEKAQIEMEVDGLTRPLVREALMNAPAITKTVRSKNRRTGKVEKLYVIKSLTFDGIPIYTKGKIDKIASIEVFYVLISSKRSTD
jgi:hypothetical protein